MSDPIDGLAGVELDKLRLRSDFSDYYDHHFDREGQTFQRFTRNAMGRREQFDHLMGTLGLGVPTHCDAGDVLDMAPAGTMWVVHTDEYAHCGEGKITLPGGALNCVTDPHAFAVRYIESSKGRSLRHLQIGRRAFLLHYRSRDDWRSNCGDVDIVFGGECHSYTSAPWPLFAVDFVRDGDGALYAIDLNTSPGMRGTGMEQVMKPADVVAEIKGFLRAKAAEGDRKTMRTETEGERE